MKRQKAMTLEDENPPAPPPRSEGVQYATEMSWLDSITDSMDINLSQRRGIMEDRGAWRAAVQRVSKGQTWLSDWTTSLIYSYQKE